MYILDDGGLRHVSSIAGSSSMFQVANSDRVGMQHQKLRRSTMKRMYRSMR